MPKVNNYLRWLSPTETAGFEQFLRTRTRIAEKRLPFFVHWVDRFHGACEQSGRPVSEREVTLFLENLGREREPWQRSAFGYFADSPPGSGTLPSRSAVSCS